MKRIAFDIETIPNNEVVGLLPEPKYKYGNTKDPKKREAIEIEAREDQISKMALNPFTCRVCAAAVFGNEDQKIISDMRFMQDISDKQEFNVLHFLISEINDAINKNGFIITFNGIAFDLPVIFGRCLALGIELSYALDFFTKRYKTWPHVDLRMLLGNWDARAAGSLDFYTRMILGEYKDEPDYSIFVKMINEGQGNIIGNSCLQHTELTYKLYQKVRRYYISNELNITPDLRGGPY